MIYDVFIPYIRGSATVHMLLNARFRATEKIA